MLSLPSLSLSVCGRYFGGFFAAVVSLYSLMDGKNATIAPKRSSSTLALFSPFGCCFVRVFVGVFVVSLGG